ncbi:hypothetical protein AJ80_09867 [Polytolypa hystricis UAMH7299]|uniref:Major facilitator superfamily (MFS) profile domain-containing protein n=1 Tax=Polytolypa hystricis (strain UAMH7299) TaxID=1447883 RepID=A0A2B7WHT9_POLH7|nr:hypothetical protein AJ80_09867 [Polytolypa hystricis UAMH7299]
MAEKGQNGQPPTTEDEVIPQLDNLIVPRANLEDRWSRLWHMKQFTAWMLYVGLGLVGLGFEWAAFPQFLAFQTFSARFGEFDPTAEMYIVSSGRQAVWNATGSATMLIGGLSAGFIMNKIGRRWWLLITNAMIAISIGLAYGSTDWKVMTGSRVILGLGNGGMGTFTPLYISENAPPELRGFYLITFNAFMVVGQFLISLVLRACVNAPGEWQWRSAVLAMFIFPFITFVLFPFFPESPHHLLANKNDEEGARKALLRLHGASKTEFVEQELTRMRESIHISKVLGKKSSFSIWDLFRGSNLRRTLVAIAVPAAQQLSGIVFVIGYIPYFLTLAGISNPFNWSMYLFTVNLVSNLASFWTVERVGRRLFVVYGLLFLGTVNIIVGAINVHPTYARYIVTIVLTYCWAAVYQLTIGALGLVVASEVATSPLRAETQSLVTASQSLFSWVFAFSVPYMINPDAGNLGGKVGFIFGSLSFCLFVVCFFLVPETRGLTFSELDWLYAQGVKPWNFMRSIDQYRASQEGTQSGSDVDLASKAVENA